MHGQGAHGAHAHAQSTSDPFAFSRGSAHGGSGGASSGHGSGGAFGHGGGGGAAWAQPHGSFGGGAPGALPGGGLGAAAAPLGGDPFATGVATMANNPMAQIGIAYGRDLVAGGVAKYMPGASALWHSLRYYFDVNNAYVVRKLRRLLFPFLLRKWTRVTLAEAAGSQGRPHMHVPGDASPAPPVLDENAPDLYLPTMGFITFVLVTGLLKGVGNSFHPDVLVAACSSMFATQVVEVLVIRAGLYALASDAPCPLLDLVAFTGYKYLGLTINALVGLFLGSSVYWVALAYTSAAAAAFLVSSLMPVVRAGAAGLLAAPGAAQPANSPATTFVLAVGVLQVLLLWWQGVAPR